MKRQVLITGGSSGIGLGLAQRFLSAGIRVLVTGRDGEKLKQAARENPGLEIFINDISLPEEREALSRYVAHTMPGLNLLINNAGIQRRVALADDHADWAERQAEINILLSAPVHLNHLLIPLLLLPGKTSTIVNVTSGGAFIPQVFAPIYSACKAALHHYTITLRHALSRTSCKVVELIPPAVQSGLAGPGLNHGVPLNEFCDAVFNALTGDQAEIGFAQTAGLIPQISGKIVSELFESSAGRFPVHTY
ncbi:SDR family NAD(P)-dependent oxidoreductase [Pedobacter sp. L105]|uniref:SDR family NAD(P)-dependent oxidoreductase n=1 Tax=Pedobacter sp. L105 TaxID=1641871 RepID=UPI00131A648F|nr:SDR family NAD(P)-dependent oxidoreductase [Pedobacter sp. L105]